MHPRLAISTLGLLVLVGCPDRVDQAPSAPASGSAAPPAQPSASATASQSATSSAAASTVTSSTPARGAISTLKADSLREMDRVRGKRLQVTGIFIKRTVARQGGPPSEHLLHTNNMVWLADTKDEADLLLCELGEGWAVGVEPLDRITVEGTAAFEDPSTIHNGPKELRLGGCTVKKAQ